MIRTWGYGRVGEEKLLYGPHTFGAFQFFKYTLLVMVEGNPPEEVIACHVALRALHDEVRANQEGNPATVLADGLRRANAALVAAAQQQGAGAITARIGAILIGKERAWCCQVGPIEAYLIRKGEPFLAFLEDPGGQLGEQSEPRIRAQPVLDLQPRDTFVLASSKHRMALDLERLCAQDWSMPQQASAGILDSWRGTADDDAVMLACSMLQCPEFIRPTTPPNLRAVMAHVQASRGKEETRDELAMLEAIEDVQPEWGKSDFRPEEEIVERAALEFKEVVEEEEEEEVKLPWYQRIAEALIWIRGEIELALEKPETRKRAKRLVAALALAAVALAVLVIGQTGDSGPAALDGGPEGFEVVEGQLVRDDAAAAPDGEQPEAVAAAEAAEIKALGAKEKENTGSEGGGGSSLPVQLGALVFVISGALGYRIWRAKQASDAEKEEEKRRIAKRQARLVQEMIDDDELKFVSRFVASDGRAGIALVDRMPGSRRAVMLLTSGPEIVNTENEFDRRVGPPSTRLVSGSEVIGVEMLEKRATATNKSGGGHKASVQRLEVVVRVADPADPVWRMAVLHEPVLSSSIDHKLAVKRAARWEGSLLALKVRAKHPPLDARIERLPELLEAGVLHPAELRLLKEALSRRRSARWRTPLRRITAESTG